MNKLSVVQSNHDVAIMEDGEVICRIFYKGFNNSTILEDKCLAYANLFAMAPNMLETLLDTIKAVEILKTISKKG